MKILCYMSIVLFSLMLVFALITGVSGYRATFVRSEEPWLYWLCIVVYLLIIRKSYLSIPKTKGKEND